MNSTIAHIIDRLSPIYGVKESQEMAYWIAEETCHLSRMEIALSTQAIRIEGLEDILLRLSQKEPLQYIFGHTQWKGLDLRVTRSTLIPRPETAELVDWILCQEPPSSRHVLDIGTGSGCIAIALKKARPQWKMIGLDICMEAVQIAAQNGEHNGVQVEWKIGDILQERWEQTMDIVVSNPPYITEREKKDMDSNVLNYEPERALFVPNHDPLLFYRTIAEKRIGKHLYFEVNEQYAHEVDNMLRGLGYTDVQIQKDMYGKERMVFGRMDK